MATRVVPERQAASVKRSCTMQECRNSKSIYSSAETSVRRAILADVAIRAQKPSCKNCSSRNWPSMISKDGCGPTSRVVWINANMVRRLSYIQKRCGTAESKNRTLTRSWNLTLSAGVQSSAYESPTLASTRKCASTAGQERRLTEHSLTLLFSASARNLNLCPCISLLIYFDFLPV